MIVASINTSSSYISGASAVASITIIDDDLPPTVFISSPASKSTIISTGNGLVLSATASDDGLPSPLTYAWTQIFGPGTTTFGTPGAATTTATFTAPGGYGLRVTVYDGQFTASDEVFVQNGGFNYATWMTQDQGPPATRGIGGESSGTFTLIGSGTGYTSANDSGHMLFRQLFTAAGDATITARLTNLTGPGTRLAGITMRDTSWKGGRRVNLMLDASGTVQFRQRATLGASDTATTIAGSAAPLWMKLVRIGGTVTASHAPDVSGAPGAWVTDGTSTIAMNNNLIVGMVVSAGASTAATATAIFDNVTVTPAISGPAQHSEDIGSYPLAGSSSDSAGTVTVTAYGNYDGSGGHFRYQQIWGDCIVTARLTNHNGSFRGAQSGVGLRDTTDAGAYAFYGNTSVDGYQVHWRSTPGGSTGVLQSSGTGYIRLVRKGNTVNAYKASSLAGPWTLNSGNIPVVLTGPLQVGLVVDAASNSVAAIGTFTNFSVTPLNTAPVVDAGTLTSIAPFNLNGTITDDGQPNPPAVTSALWAKVSGPGTVTFANSTLEDTLATLGLNGTYTLRLYADDGDTVTFDDLTFTGYKSLFAQWLVLTGAGDGNDTITQANLDPDSDGITNFAEWAFGLNPTVGDRAAITVNGSSLTRHGIPALITQSGVNHYALFGRRHDYLTVGLTYAVQFSADLQSWENSATTSTVVAGDGVIDAVTVLFPSVQSNGAKTRFFRVVVSAP